ncbi:MAG TPA: serine/threonine-protein kinase [Kofleriaceae bacterium]|nr:serine/threonine-protein kinase [Kofleriaceae bacterium]
MTGLEGWRLPGGVRLDAAVAEGASGVVFRGWHEVLGRAVAVKVSHASDQLAAARALREARIVASLDAPGIVRVYEAGRLDDGRAWVAMEWIDGVSLEDAAGTTPWPAAQVAAIGADIARALARAHAAGVVHRDLKPANVMIRRTGEIVVVDFGIARAAGEAATSHSKVAGTPHYMAPEQALGESVDPRTDLYALGCVLFRLATGRVPFDGSAIEVMLAHLGHPAPVIEGGEPRLTGVIGRLLAKRPGERPAAADVLADELDGVARGASGEVAARSAIDPHEATVPALALPDPARTIPSPPRRPARTGGNGVAVVIATFLAASALGGASYRLARGLHGGEAASAPAPAPPAPPPPPAIDPSAPVVLVVDGGYAMRATLPRAPAAGADLVVELAIWDADGEPIDARQLAVTVSDPYGRTVAVGVPGKAGVFPVRQRTPVAGTYVITAFAPRGETTFAVSVEVAPAPAPAPAPAV